MTDTNRLKEWRLLLDERDALARLCAESVREWKDRADGGDRTGAAAAMLLATHYANESAARNVAAENLEAFL